MIRVYDFNCWMSDEDARVAIGEIERGRRYYNNMIAELNRRVQEELPVIEALSAGDRFLARIVLLWPWFDPSLAQQATADGDDPKSKQAMAIYACIAHHARDVRHDMPTGPSGCYTGTYHAVHAAFDAAIGDKRKGTWPGEPYHFRRMRDNRGATCGVHLQGGSYTWSGLLSGQTSIVQVCDLDSTYTQTSSLSHEANHYWERRIVRLKVAKLSDPLILHVKLHRQIPHHAVITHVTLARSGDYGSRIRWRLLITAKIETTTEVTRKDTIGVDTGFRVMPNGAIQVGMTSEGDELSIPAYAVRMNQKIDMVDRQRKELALQIRDQLPPIEGQGLPVSPGGHASYIERNGLHGFGEYLEQENHLHCLQDHLAKRAQRIRTDVFRKFVHSLRDRQVFIEKLKLRALAKDEESDNAIRKYANLSALTTMFKNTGAKEVKQIEGRGDAHLPDVDFAEKIREAGESEKLEIRPARKAIRKYRKSKRAA